MGVCQGTTHLPLLRLAGRDVVSPEGCSMTGSRRQLLMGARGQCSCAASKVSVWDGSQQQAQACSEDQSKPRCLQGDTSTRFFLLWGMRKVCAYNFSSYKLPPSGRTQFCGALFSVDNLVVPCCPTLAREATADILAEVGSPCADQGLSSRVSSSWVCCLV